MKTIGRLLTFIVLGTWVLSMMDWKPIHYAWWHYGEYPEYAQNWGRWAAVRMWTARIACPPCGALAENYYYVLMEVEAGEDEQTGVLPVGHKYNPVNPHGNWSFYWGQGEGRPWRRVSMLSFYLYWLPNTVLWWLVVGDFFTEKKWWIGEKMKILAKWAYCKVCQVMRRFKKDHEKKWYCRTCGSDL